MAAGVGLLIHTKVSNRVRTFETVVSILSLASGGTLRTVRIPGFPQAGPTRARGRIFVTVSGPPYGRVVCLGVPPGSSLRPRCRQATVIVTVVASAVAALGPHVSGSRARCQARPAAATSVTA